MHQILVLFSSQFSSDVSLQVSKNDKQIPPLKECGVLLNSEETTNISSARTS